MEFKTAKQDYIGKGGEIQEEIFGELFGAIGVRSNAG